MNLPSFPFSRVAYAVLGGCGLLLSSTLIQAAPIKPMTITSTGPVRCITPSGKIVPFKQRTPLELGTYVETGPHARAVIAVAPGQAIHLDALTRVEIVSSSIQSDASRVAVARLVHGNIRCAVHHPDDSPQHLTILTPSGSMGAKGTFWKSQLQPELKQLTAVIGAGVVKWDWISGKIDLTPGCVMTAFYQAGNSDIQRLKVVNLLNGNTTLYQLNAEPQVSISATSELSEARESFQKIINESNEASHLDRLEIAKVIDEFNRNLSKHNLAPLVAPREWLLLGSDLSGALWVSEKDEETSQVVSPAAPLD